jgi:hypothetical protein
MLFAQPTGAEPFVGLIVTPYDTSSESAASHFNCITVSHQWDHHHVHRIPYQLEPEVIPLSSEAQLQTLLGQLQTLLAQNFSAERSSAQSFSFVFFFFSF